MKILNNIVKDPVNELLVPLGLVVFLIVAILVANR